MGGRIRPPTTSAEPARAASHLKGRSDSGGGAKRLDSTGTEATPLLHLPTRFPEDPLKGVNILSQAHAAMEAQKNEPVEDFGSTRGTPCDVDWWSTKEREYGRNLETEKRERRNPDASHFIGFFGASSDFSYDVLANSATGGCSLDEFSDAVLPCDCTE